MKNGPRKFRGIADSRKYTPKIQGHSIGHYVLFVLCDHRVGLLSWRLHWQILVTLRH